MEYKVGYKFRITEDYADVAQYCRNNGLQIEELESDEEGRLFEVRAAQANPRTEIEMQISALKSKLADTDYQAIKYAEDEMTAEEYAPVKEQRKAWRAEINELEAKLAEGDN